MNAPPPMRWRVESWDPGYGASVEEQQELARSSARLELDVELAQRAWRPIDPDPAAPGWPTVLFVDGVRRIDAMAWVLGPEDANPEDTGREDVHPGDAAELALCASYAAGVVCSQEGSARLLAAEVRRGLFSAAAGATDVLTGAGTYARVRAPVRAESAAAGQDLSLAVQHALGEVEVAVAAAARESLSAPDLDGADLLVVDGPLRGRQHLPRALGYVKTHRAEYLPAGPHGMVGTLRPGQRTPVFGLGTSWQRYTWYLKLPGSSDAPWTGVVRVECSGELPVAEAVSLATRAQLTLCRYASTEYKDARAPQNLYPIAGLERELRRRLGDQALLYRAIRRASSVGLLNPG